jgi:hypothetical protein
MAPPCVDTQGAWHFPVCNRGDTDVTTSKVHIGLYDTTAAGHMSWYPGCATNQSPANPDKKVWSVNLAAAGPKVPAGGCLDITNANGTTGYDTAATSIDTATLMSRKWGVMVNHDKGTTECNYCNDWQIFDPTVSACLPPSKPDFTVGVGCTDNNGHLHIPLCNRGWVDANSGTVDVIDWTSNPNTSGSSTICQLPTSGAYKGRCMINLAVAKVKKDQCIDIDLTAPASGITCDSGLFGSGNHTSMVNPPSGTYGTAYTQLDEADICNNQSFVYTQTGSCAAYGVQPPPPATTTYNYTASCPAGYTQQWNQFAYTSTVPDSSEVDFQVSTAPLLTDGGYGTFTTPVQVAKVVTPGTSDPQSCPIGGPSPCPKDLATLLGANAYNSVIRIGVTLISTTAIPTVGGWQITYNCVPNE